MPNLTGAGLPGFTLENAGAGTLQAGVTTLGQVFKEGHLAPGQALVARIGQKTVPVQVDVKNTHPDGSVKMAVLSFERPLLASRQSVEVSLEKATAPTGQAVVDLAAVSAKHSFVVELTPAGQPKIAIDVLDLLRKGLKDGTASFWQKGTLATEARIEVDLPGSMRLKFDVTAWRDGQISVDAMFNNDQAMQATGGRVVYDVVARLDGREVIRESVDQAQYQNWHTLVSSGGANGGQGLGSASSGWMNIRHDVTYLGETGAIPKFDLSVRIPETTLQGYAAAAAAPGWGEPLAANGVTKYMPMTGGRGDIGPVTRWQADWLLSGDARAAQFVLGQAEAAGAVPWHHWDAANGTWLNTDNYPKLWTDARGGTGRPGDPKSTGLVQQVSGTTGWSPDLAHQPELSAVPYVLTGERWILDNLQAQAAGSIMMRWPGPRLEGQGLVANEGQVRAGAWVLRTIDNAAWLSPDGTPEQAYFQKISDNNWSWLVSKIPEWTAWQGEAHGWLPSALGQGMLAPWQQDFFATTAAAAARRGNDEARTFLEWQANFLVGRFTHAEDGFNPAWGTGNGLIFADPGNPAQSNYSRTPYKTWAEIADQMVARGLAPAPKDEWASFNYNQMALATLALIHDVTGMPEAAQAYEAILALKPRGAASLADYGRDPTYAVTIPELFTEYLPPTGTPNPPPAPKPPVVVEPAPPSSSAPKPPAKVEPEPPSSSGPKPPAKVEAEPPSSSGPKPPAKVEAEPPSSSGPALPTPQTLAVGEGQDTLVLKLSQDFWQVSAQYFVTINGKSLGQVFTAGAIASSKQVDTLIIRGDWGDVVKLSVAFLNDSARAGEGDRNLYINDIEANGVPLGINAVFHRAGTQTFTIEMPDDPAPGADSGAPPLYPITSEPGDLLIG